MLLSAADCLIAAFGGVRRTARAVGRTPGAVIQWKKSGRIPISVQRHVLHLARNGGIDITAEELIIGRCDRAEFTNK